MVTDNFLLKISATPPRVVTLRLAQTYLLSVCAPARDRTEDLILKRDLLYQLSYGRMYLKKQIKFNRKFGKKQSSASQRWSRSFGSVNVFCYVMVLKVNY